MKTYRDLKSYINDEWYDYIFNHATNFIKNNISDDEIATNRVPDPLARWLEEVEVTSLYTKVLKDDDVKLYASVRARLAFKGYEYGSRRNDVETETRDFYLQMVIVAKFNRKFRNIRIVHKSLLDNKEKFNLDESSTSDFIPYISEGNIEEYATKFLREVYPEALEKPMALPITEVLDRLDLGARSKKLPNGVFGSTYFLPDHNENISSGTIIYDPDKSFIEGAGSINNTIIHECVHWFFHKKYFDLMHFLNPEIKSIVCPTIEQDIRNPNMSTENFKWMEWQANALAPRILMPAKTTLEYYNKVYPENLKAYNDYELWALERTIEQVADYFKVSKTSAKIRLSQLGIKSVYGIGNYVDGDRIPPFKSENPRIGISQTFHVDFKDAVRLSYSNRRLREALEKKQIIYVDGVFVINNQKYVYRQSNQNIVILSDYALNNMDECCLVFDIKKTYTRKFDDRFYSLFFMAKIDKDDSHYGDFNANDVVNEEVLGRSVDLAEVIEDAKEIDEFLSSHRLDTFTPFFNALLVYKNLDDYSDYAISELTLLDNKTISNYRNGKTKPDNIKKVLAICGGLCLEPKLSSTLIAISGLSLGVMPNDLHYAYEHLLNQCWERGLRFWNKKLKALGIPNATIP